MKKTILLTGAYGFIGHEILRQLNNFDFNVVVLDCLTYAAINFPGYKKDNEDAYDNTFYDRSITDDISYIFEKHKIDLILNAAAESHVDNSIESPDVFIQTNVAGTLNLLKQAVKYNCKFLQVSTDEVYGSNTTSIPNQVTDSLNPSSPYSVSKASAEMLVKSYGDTYGLKYVITRGSNTYGPGQHPEKFLPKLINCIRTETPFSLYGNGCQSRQWIHVEDHAFNILMFAKLLIEGTYNKEVLNIGSHFDPISNIDLISLVKKACPDKKILVELVPDRLNHDTRYFIKNESTNLRYPNIKNLVDFIKEEVYKDENI